MIHYHVASTTLHESIDEEMVLLNLDSGEYFGLHANGRRFFEVLCKHSTIDDRVACLQSAYFQTRRPFRIWRRHLLVSPKTPIDRHCCTQLTELFRTLNRPVDTAAHRHIVRMTWLPKSLTLQRMLARLDVAATIRTRLLTTEPSFRRTRG